jgi:hypothetical protein
MTARTSGRLGALALCLLAALAAATSAAAVGPKVSAHGRPTFDVNATAAARSELRARGRDLDARPPAAVRALERRLGRQGVVELDPLTATPRVVARLDGFLTGSSSAPAESVARAYLEANREVFRVDPGSLRLGRSWTDVHGVTHLSFVQEVGGVPVLNGGVRVNVGRDGRIVDVTGSPVAFLPASLAEPAVAAEQAVATAIRDRGGALLPYAATRRGDARRTTELASGDRAALGLYRTTDGVHVAWETFVRAGSAQYRSLVDAVTGELLFSRSLTQDSTALAYESYPGAPVGGTQRAFDLTAKGWLPAGAKHLSGPNTHVWADVDDDNVADRTEEIDASGVSRGERNWLWPLQRFFPAVAGCDTLVCTWLPDRPGSWRQNVDQSGQQLFVLLNTFHDHLEAAPIGFDDDAGNFEGDDVVWGQALDGAATGNNLPDGGHVDNANMSTPPDGQSPTMQMYLWHQPFAGDADPFIAADGSNEAVIVYHEYTHGLSNRLVVDANGNSTLNSLQAGAMGEAWSDWYAFDFLVEEGFAADQPGVADLRVGHYVGNGADLIRTEPLDCTPSMTAAQGCAGGVATGEGGYTYGDMGKIIGIPEVHADGEIWGQTLWQLRGALGSAVTEALVTEAMTLSPDDPTMLDMRNAILQADQALFGGSHAGGVWDVFASRGMGFFAAAVDGSDFQVVESFAGPPPATPAGTLSGTVTDTQTGDPIEGAAVAFGGHDSGVGVPDLVGTSDAAGDYSIAGVPFGEYGKVNVFAAGYDRDSATVVVDGDETRDWSVLRDWISGLAGARITEYTGADFSPFFCGPDKAIDQTGNGWLSTTDLLGGPKHIVVRLPETIDVGEFLVDPSHPCGVAGSASTAGFSIETSPDGTTWTPAAQGTFTAADRYRLNVVPATAGTAGVRFVRFTMISPQVPGGTAATCPGPFDGCTYMGMTELVVHGAPSS